MQLWRNHIKECSKVIFAADHIISLSLCTIHSGEWFYKPGAHNGLQKCTKVYKSVQHIWESEWLYNRGSQRITKVMVRQKSPTVIIITWV